MYIELFHECVLEMRWVADTIIIPYPIRASGITVLLKTPTKYREFFLILFVKTTDFQVVFNFDQTHTVTIFAEHGSYTMMAKPITIRTLELHYPMIQVLIKTISCAVHFHFLGIKKS